MLKLIINIIFLSFSLFSLAQNNNTVIISGGSGTSTEQTINGIPLSQDIGGVEFQEVNLSDTRHNCFVYRAFNFNPFPVTVIVKYNIKYKYSPQKYSDWETRTKTIVLQAAVNGKPTYKNIEYSSAAKGNYCNFYINNFLSITRKLGGK